MALVTVAEAATDPVVVRRLELALAMIAMGASVFPLQPGGKKPLVGRTQGGKGFLDASPDPHMAQIFLSNPGKPNYGVAFPEGSDIIVLDLDGGNDASNPDWKDDWQRLYDELGPPGLTYIVRTPSGGRHVYYRWRTDLYGPLPPGDEMLGWTVRKPWKGYLVGPGSTIGDEVYEPVGLDTISDLPEAWARAAIAEAGQRHLAGPQVIQIKGGVADVKPGHRHAYLRDKARHLVGVGLTGEVLFAAVMDINRQLAEPKTEDAVRRAIGDAESKFAADPVAPDGSRPRQERQRSTTPAEPIELPFYTAAQVVAMPEAEISWAWFGYLAHGAITELVGGPKVGKTTLIFDMVGALVSNEQFLDLRTDPGPVVILTEQGPRSLREVLVRTALVERSDVHFLMHRDVRGQDWAVVVATAKAYCEAVGARVLVVDTLPAFAGLAGETENNAGDALEAMTPLMECATAGLAILVNRHQRKGGAGASIEEAGRGSSAFSGAVDVILTLRRKAGMGRPTIRELLAASRFDDTPEELILDLVDGHYVSLGNEQAVAAQEAESAILEALSNSDAHGDVPMCTTRELVEITEKVRRTVERAIKSLVDAQMIERVGAGGRKDPYRFKLSPTTRAHHTPPKGGDAQVRTTSSDQESQDGQRFAADAGESSAARPDHVEASWVEPCRDYSNHQRHHRRTDAGWICDICTPREAA